MSKIKIKQCSTSESHIPDFAKLSSENTPPAKDRPRKPQKSYKHWIVAGSIIIAGTGLTFALWQFQNCHTVAFADIMPERAVIFSVINQETLYTQALPLQGLIKEQNLYIQPALSKMYSYLSESGLDLRNDIQPHFKQKAAFIMMPANAETSFPFMIFLEKKNALTDISAILDGLDKKLQNDFDVSSTDYRHMKIVTLKPLYEHANLPKMYAYAQIENYLVITNSLETAKQAVDKIVDN